MDVLIAFIQLVVFFIVGVLLIVLAKSIASNHEDWD